MWEELYITPREEAVDRRFSKSLQDMRIETAKWYWWWLGSILAGVLALGLEVTGQMPIPQNSWLWLLFVGFIFAPIVTFHFMRVDRDKYLCLWDGRKVLMQKLRELEDLRAEGAALHIEGKRLKENEYPIWSSKLDDWVERCIDIATAIHPAEGGTVKTLGVFDPKLTIGTEPLNLEHQRDLLNIVRRLNILIEIRDRWSGC